MANTKVREANDPSFIVTTTELCRLLQLEHKQVSRLRMAGLPQLSKSRYSISDVFVWIQSGQRTGDDNDPSLQEAKRDLTVVQKAKVEVEVRKLKNELVPYEEVKHLMMGVIQVLASGLDALPARTGARLAAMTSTPLAEDEIENECRSLRQQLAVALRRFEEDYKPLHGPD